ncbi:xyloglucan xylosyltransferase-like protein [Selaginella moellendorffii]|uniref:Xyloglucan xylosyltransferase-like protein n=1 Tax=Selaginella moellendorffii TaxID=88036 RepID=D8RTL4_SELML|nr:xyloglucan 6-xylosyltransferase 2 [Selaginella moellendorffii]XP_024535074.1 xyloglucan 6-xylosyltransferase 2 [Selaginella moellendorffii]XP_024535075.1 xyloglucan 6-xylosyltransferase 2 [Selaginella moellendorffii]XP_024535076.1 xyloglucan 6-xylosyltransferase 2 [Selaginella moellendorffii]EFJ24695.1 xyloglucan xylosyltransferase-like protein [Selaginella moellendorffii]|eukprot:XP_002974473.1 xyloglucan 6-xylosyltransferase 2 [Selaginella moellendorffii]
MRSITRSFSSPPILSPTKIRRLQRTFHNVKLMVMCGMITILVLRGTIGAGKFGTPAQDLREIREHLPRRHKEAASRVLAEAHESRKKAPGDREEREEEERSAGSSPYSLGPKISDWNEQRSQWLLENRAGGGAATSKILLVTGSQPNPCDNPVGDHYLLKSLKNKIDYCRIHGIEIFYNMAHLDSEMAGYWAKLPLLRKLLLSHPDVEWLWWMDSDAMFTDMSFAIPLDKYANHNMVLHGWDELVYAKKNWIGLNTGSFLLRNCQWSLDLLDAWAPMGPKGKIREDAGKILTRELVGRPEFEADDQSALVYLLATQRSQWGDGVFLESSYYLHGYWAILVDKYEEMIAKNHPGLGDDRWPLVTHFVGCKPCGSYGDYPVEQCLREMERAFNFGDNQILGGYGFQHRRLESARVKRTRNDTARPLDDLPSISRVSSS